MSRFMLVVCLLLLTLSCKTTENKEVIISGKLISSNSKTIYLNVIDNFDYLNDAYLIDSVKVSENGEFAFKKIALQSKLISLSTKKFKPYTYQIYRVAPETYYYGNCAKFFTNIPTFYISNEDNIHINWYEKAEIDSINSPDNSAINQVKLRTFYLGTRVFNIDDLNYMKQQNVAVNWKNILLKIDDDLKNLDLKNLAKENSFDNYLYTEVYLGNLNEFLNWFEESHPDKIKESIKNYKNKNIYADVFSMYETHKWNSKSLEYFKFTERYVNYFMNIKQSNFKTYHLPSEEKKQVVKEVLKDENKESYLKLINSQLNKK